MDKSKYNIIESIVPDELKNKEAIVELLKRVEPVGVISALDNHCKICIDENDEIKFFKLLLPSFTEAEVCRYTSLNSLFTTINTLKQGMCCLNCMNDRTEGQYADRILNSYSPMADIIIKSAMSLISRKQINSKFNNDIIYEIGIDKANTSFILSLCGDDMIDNLDMWRLYGDNAKGVCIIYEIDYSFIHSQDEFFLARVSYGKDVDKHPELQLIKDINDKLFDKQWVIKQWGIWKHFFKPFQFRNESEVRLLYVNDKTDMVHDRTWFMSNNNIITRMMLFDCGNVNNAFPLKIKNIILGPNVYEEETNARQLKFLLFERGITRPSDQILFHSKHKNIYR